MRWPEIGIVPCKDIIPPDHNHNDQNSLWEFHGNGFYCIDPKDATLNLYEAGKSFQEVEKTVRIGFEICQKTPQPGVTCWDYEKIQKWATDNWFTISWVSHAANVNLLTKNDEEFKHEFIIHKQEL